MHAFTSASTRSPPRFTPKQCSIVRIHSWETSARRAALGEQGQGLPNPGGCHIRVQHMQLRKGPDRCRLITHV